MSLSSKIPSSPTTTSHRTPTAAAKAARTGEQSRFAGIVAALRMPTLLPSVPSAPLRHASETLAAEHARVSPHPRDPRDGERDSEGRDERREIAVDPLDPTVRNVAQLAPPAVSQPAAAAEDANAAMNRAVLSMEDLMPRLVRRIAWAGDRKKGSVQLELGAGPHAGTVVTVHAEDGRVRVELHGDDKDDLGSKIEARLARRGLSVDSVR